MIKLLISFKMQQNLDIEGGGVAFMLTHNLEMKHKLFF